MASWPEQIYNALTGQTSDAARSTVKDVSESNSSQTKIDVEPNTDGITESVVDITVLNDGSDTFWVTDGTAHTKGRKLKPGQSTTYEEMLNTDGVLALHPETSNGLNAEIQYVA